MLRPRTRPSSLLRPSTFHSFSFTPYSSTAASTKSQPLLSTSTTASTDNPNPNQSHTTQPRSHPPQPPQPQANANAPPVLKDQLRTLLRETAQPVAVITSLMPPGTHSHFPHARDSKCRFHGATLSSFSSISMDPYPLVSFALRIPSRMAVSLGSEHAALRSSSASSSSSAALSSPASQLQEQGKPLMTINLLSHLQPHTAHLFSRPDLHPEPFSDVTYTLSPDGLPVLDDSLAAMTCELIGGPIPLHDLDFLEGSRTQPTRWDGEGGGVSSELFIARVVRVEDVRVKNEDEDGNSRKRVPLIYHQRGFTYCHPEQLPISSSKPN